MNAFVLCGTLRALLGKFIHMSDTKMPAAEAESVVPEMASYELAFHVLPTVAEGEVASVVDSIKSRITKAGGEITSEEAPARFELAYEIVKYLEGKNRKFTSAYFGWIRFTMSPEEVESLNEDIDGIKELLRTMLIRLTKLEEANPFYFHEALASKQVENVEEIEEDDEDEDDSEASDADNSTEGDESDDDSEETE